MTEDPCSASCTVRGKRHRRTAEDSRGVRSGGRRGSNPRPSKVASELRARMERWQNGEIATSSLVFVVKGNKVAQRLVMKGIKAARV